MARPRCICGCGGHAVHNHHAVTRMELRKHGGDPKDARNLVPVTLECHFAHHGRSKVLPLAVLPDSVYEFAVELMGAEAAFVHLGRMYAGDDPRLGALLS